MATPSFLSDDLPGILFAAIFISLSLAIHFRLRRQRFNELQELADRYHLTHTDTLPHDFPLEAIAKWGWLRTRDIFSGQVDGDTLLVMDTRVGWGRQQYTRTIVARRFSFPRKPPTLPKDLWYKEAGAWRIAFPQPGLFILSSKLRTNLVVQVWSLLAGPDAPRLKPHGTRQPDTSSDFQQPTEILIHPRKPHTPSTR